MAAMSQSDKGILVKVSGFLLAFVILLSRPIAAQSIIEIDVRGEWKATYSDNLNLAIDGETKEGGIVLNASPGFDVRLKFAKTEFAIDYWMDYFYFLDDKSTDIRHNLFGTFDTYLFDRKLNISARAGIQQEFIDRQGGYSNSDANRSNNRRTIQNYNTSAQWRSRVFDLANLEMGYRFGQVYSPADDLDDETLTVNFSDTISHNLTGTLSSGKRFHNFEWKVSGNYQRVEKSLIEEDFSEWRYAAEGEFKPNRFISFDFGYGIRGNNAQTDKLDLDNRFWSYGVSLKPGPKLNLSFNREDLGSRNYDTLSVYYQITSRVNFRLTHSVDFTSNALGLADRLQQTNFEQEFGIDDGTGLPVDDSDISFSLSDIDYEQYIWNGTLTWNKKRDSFYFTGNRERRVFDADIPNSWSWGGSAGWERQINRLTTISATVSYRKNFIDGGNRIDEYKTGAVDWQKTLSKYFKAALSYAYTRRSSTDPTGNLSENAITFYLRGTF
ncbi:hypothetical protein QGN29_13720 [Temperatibacter marinus]|uniref:TIGR03016 family PEP-CTERM system-associated outer membrane protein n=1 Tax=Temperatibacter marinus TaxID=1456591 RepID=A0AA52EGZ1_9PROT|nr:hypothetical protein [Temperatibacter marinus]WND02605.1 hypothetical protein QGN29_13720 [Temperatibacter marinus]